MRRGLALLVVAGVLSAAAAAARADAWQRHRSTAGGFTLSTPATWVDFSRATPEVLARVKTNPRLQVYIDLVRKTHALKFLAVDVNPSRTAEGFATNLNVAVTRSLGDARLQADATAAQLRGLGFLVGTLRETTVKLPAGRATELRYRARYTTGGTIVSITQFMLDHAGSVAILTYTTVPLFEPTYAPVFARSARSLRFFR